MAAGANAYLVKPNDLDKLPDTVQRLLIESSATSINAKLFTTKSSAIKKEFSRGEALQSLLLNFTRLMMIQISQTALCNRLHTVEERLSRWLLLCCDRTGTDKLQLTQKFLSIMLGVNRATVTITAITLQSAGYIKYKRGQIIITDREGLKDFTCDCYRTVKKEYDRRSPK